MTPTHSNIEIWNNIALIKDDTHFTKWVKETGRLDHHTGFLNFLQPYLSGTVLDIGANIGTHTIFYTKHAPHVHAFEPNPLAFECLFHNLHDLAECYHVAVGDKEGWVGMSPPDKNYGAMYTVPGHEVRMITVDSLELTQCNFMKIDVEGDELAVLRGANETIHRFRPFMCIEVNPSTLTRKHIKVRHLVKHIKDLNYSTHQRVPQDETSDILCLPN